MALRSIKPLVLLAWMVAGSASAVELLPERSAAAKCLTPPQERPVPLIYPSESLRRMAAGTVRIELTFTDPAGAPQVQLLPGEEVDPALVAAVRGHVDQYRVPCLVPGGEPVRFRQEFVFSPNDGKKVTWTRPQHDDASAANRTCVAHVDKGSSPDWPLRVKDSVGKVLLQMSFVAPDRAPAIEVLGIDANHPFARAAADWAVGLRAPCLSTPFVARQLFVFMHEGLADVKLRDMPLTTFLRSVRAVAELPVFFDFRTMGCPFEVKVRYWRPYEFNAVGEVGNSLATRRPFLDWLSGLELDIKPEQQRLVLGDEFTLAVPCGTLDL